MHSLARTALWMPCHSHRAVFLPDFIVRALVQAYGRTLVRKHLDPAPTLVVQQIFDIVLPTARVLR